jgi:hypothetical protein
MSLITRRFSVSELSQKILEMATTGVYRESVFEALQPVATKKQISEAIAHAKQYGLHSVASLRDPELGTYYQLDPVKFEALFPTLHATPPGKDADLMQRLTNATRTTQHMLMLAQAFGLVLLLSGFAAWLTGLHQLSFGFWGASMSAILLWRLQRQLSQKISFKD